MPLTLIMVASLLISHPISSVSPLRPGRRRPRRRRRLDAAHPVAAARGAGRADGAPARAADPRGRLLQAAAAPQLHRKDLQRAADTAGQKGHSHAGEPKIENPISLNL